MSMTDALECESTYPLPVAKVQRFVDDGYLVVPDLISPDETELLKRDTAFIARGGYPCETLKPLPANYSDADALREILCIHQPHYISPVMREFVLHPRICSVLSRITAAHLPFWDGSVKCMQSMLFVKPPGFQGQGWHQDEIYIPTRDRSLIGAWIALDPATQANGCLWVLPGSHRSGYLYPQRPHCNPSEYDYGPESYGFDDAGAVPVEVEPGTVVFFNGYLLHKSLKNRSSMYRRVLVSHYMNSWSLLPWSLKEDERTANADRRSVIPVSGIDPYAWEGYEETSNDVWLRTCAANDKRVKDEHQP